MQVIVCKTFIQYKGLYTYSNIFLVKKNKACINNCVITSLFFFFILDVIYYYPSRNIWSLAIRMEWAMRFLQYPNVFFAT